jgi:hypothetical protein
MGGVVSSIVNVGKKAVGSIVGFIAGANPLVSLGVSLFLSWALRPKVPEIPDFATNEFDDFEKGILINKQSNDSNIPVIYGERLVGGTRVFMETSGSDNTYLYMAIVMSEGEINSIEEIRVDDKVVNFASSLTDGTEVEVDSADENFYKADPTVDDSSAESLIRLEPHFGTDNQSASSLLSTLDSWGSNHKLSGLCYLALRFKWNQDAFTGIPKIQAKIKGKKVKTYNASLVEQSASYQTNPAWCLLDYLTNTRYGKGLAVSEIDLQSFYDASQVCVTQVTPYSGGSDINIFDCNTALDTSKPIIDNVREFLKGCRGYLPYNAGKYNLIIETTGSASITLTEDNIIGGYSLSTPTKNDRYNRVIVGFVNPDRNFQVDEVQFPPLDESGLADADKHENMKTVDGGFLLEGRFNFTTLTSQYQAEEMAEVILRRSREALSLGINVDFNGYDLAIGDIVNITHSSLGFSAKPFRVLGITFNTDLTVGLSLVEYQATHYTWASKTQATAIPTTNLPNPFSVESPSISATDELLELFDGSVVSKLVVTITSTDKFVNDFEVQYKESSATSYRLLRRGSNKIVEKYPVKEGVVFDIRCRAINSLGVTSAFTTIQHEVDSAFEPPQDVQNYSIDVVGDKLHHTFDAVPDLDLDFYEIRYTSDTTETAYANTVVLVPRIGRPATSVVTPYVAKGKFFIKAVDKFGFRSTNYASQSIATQVLGERIETVQTLTEHPTFSGTKSNVSAIDSTLQLDTALFDSISGNFDDALGFFDGGNGTIVSSGTYDFTNNFDFNSVLKFNVLIDSLIVNNINFIDNFDSASGFFDSREGLFDGGENASIDTNAILQISTSQDASTYTSYQDFKAGDYVARAVKFRLKMTSSNSQESPQVSQLALKLSLPTRIEKGSNVSSGTDTAGKTITFGSEYYQTPSLTVIGQNMATGDFFTISSKGTASFVVEFFNSSGSTVDRTFDYQAIGIGQKQ